MGLYTFGVVFVFVPERYESAKGVGPPELGSVVAVYIIHRSSSRV